MGFRIAFSLLAMHETVVLCLTHSNGNGTDCVHSLFSSFLFGSVCSYSLFFGLSFFFWHILLVRAHLWRTSFFPSGIFLIILLQRLSSLGVQEKKIRERRHSQTHTQTMSNYRFLGPSLRSPSHKKIKNNNFGFGVGSIELDLYFLCALPNQFHESFAAFFSLPSLI